ncbi:hypothetical protein V1478_014875 [Vespula squamosa]|uniref:Uncharacterized protein n=1 Tax=Vespula squamosa TaxID=30214 RepID=A0ABD2A486_VESSQ
MTLLQYGTTKQLLVTGTAYAIDAKEINLTRVQHETKNPEKSLTIESERIIYDFNNDAYFKRNYTNQYESMRLKLFVRVINLRKQETRYKDLLSKDEITILETLLDEAGENNFELFGIIKMRNIRLESQMKDKRSMVNRDASRETSRAFGEYQRVDHRGRPYPPLKRSRIDPNSPTNLARSSVCIEHRSKNNFVRKASRILFKASKAFVWGKLYLIVSH